MKQIMYNYAKQTCLKTLSDILLGSRMILELEWWGEGGVYFKILLTDKKIIKFFFIVILFPSIAH